MRYHYLSPADERSHSFENVVMDPATLQRWFDPRVGFHDPIAVGFAIGIAGLLILAFLIIFVLGRTGKIGKARFRELKSRTLTWVFLALIIFVPILLGAFWTILSLFLLSIFCYREFARITGLFRNYMVSAATVIGIVTIFFAVLDHWYGLFAALPSLGVALIAAMGVFSDRPKGYLQRVALAVLAFLMFGVSLGHVAYMANDPGYRSILILFLVAVSLNDVFAYISGNLFGKRKLAPQTSPNKTIGGALGAILGTTLLVWLIGREVFSGTRMDSTILLAGLGIVLSLTGQLGDLVISSVKRDLGIKDTGTILPGHGGFLDRFDSMLLAGPAFFHYVGVFNGFGLQEPMNVLTNFGQ